MMYEKMIDIDPTTMQEASKDTTATPASKDELKKEAEELMEKISGQRIKLKKMRESKAETAEGEQSK